MIKFSLQHIAEHAPYELLLSENDFTFRTDLGIHYSVSFNKEDIVLGGCDTYQDRRDPQPPRPQGRGHHPCHH